MHRSAAAAAVVVPLLAVGLTPLTSASAAAPYKGANTAAVQDDFNGDGYRDLAVGASNAANGSVRNVGSVVVLYGSASSVSPTRRTVITQASPGIPGTPEIGDTFGAALASADLDRDGYADLIVGAKYEKVGDEANRGSVTIVWGGPNGLSGGAALPVPAGFGVQRENCAWGSSLAVGDMNGDGAPELSVGSACMGTSHEGPFTRTGQPVDSYDAVLVPSRSSTVPVMGDVNGDGEAERFWLPGVSGPDGLNGPIVLDDGRSPDGDSFNEQTVMTNAYGALGQIGDINGDGYGDLVTGVPGEDIFGTHSSAVHVGGEIQVFYGSAQGIAPDQPPQVFDQDTFGIPGSSEVTDKFGGSLSIGDVNGDGYADVLVGSRGESIGSANAAGMVTLLRGTVNGLTTVKATGYTQNVAGVPGTAESDDQFGGAVRLADLTGDGKAEMAVGVPLENSDGCLWTARGSSSGPVLKGTVNIGGQSTGVAKLSGPRFFAGTLSSSNAP